MNKTIEDFTRNTIKEKLALCTEGEQLFFKRMYSHLNLDKPINEVVDLMPLDKLSWALTQIEASLAKK